MIRFSVVIQNDIQEYLICETANIDTQKNCEFPGGEISIDELPPFSEFLEKIRDILLKDVSIEVCELTKLEMYFKEEPFFLHTIFVAEIKTGVPRAIKYKSVRWVALDSIPIELLNLYGIQVFQKIDECGYCQFLRERRSEIDEFFGDYFKRAEDNLAILEALKTDEKNDTLYMLAFKQEMVHLRASLIENSKLKKNITVQNYFRLYGRDDLAKCIDELLKIEVMEKVSLKELIKTSVDKFIAHYDKPSPKEKEVYDYCVSVFSISGRFPLEKFVRLLDGYIMSLIMQMWYDAGELGRAMSERCFEEKEYLINYSNSFAAEIISVFQNEL